jgi:putative tryptophan/tyrosine transport system substrate-binding protein
MRRRDAIIALVATAAVWPFGARAQSHAKAVVGFLSSRSPAESSNLVAAIQAGLREATEGKFEKVTVEYRWAEGRFERLPDLALDLIRQNVGVILTAGNTVSALAAQRATQTIPIVFVIGDDPVKAGLVTSLNRPNGNITGITVLGTALEAKRLELLYQLAPASTVGFLLNPNGPNRDFVVAEVQDAARRLHQRLILVSATGQEAFDEAFQRLIEEGAGALAVGADPIFTIQRKPLIRLAAKNKLPAIYQWREFAEDGGLISYGTNLADGYRLAAVYAGRILQGVKPADLPVQQAAKFELVINLKTANALGLTVPPSLLARADEVIE